MAEQDILIQVTAWAGLTVYLLERFIYNTSRTDNFYIPLTKKNSSNQINDHFYSHDEILSRTEFYR